MIKKLISLLIAMAMILPVMVTPVAYAVEISPAQTVSGVQATDMVTVAKQLAKAEADNKRYFDCYVYEYDMMIRVDAVTNTAIVTEIYYYLYDVTIPETIENLNYYWGYDEETFEYLDLYGDFTIIGITADGTSVSTSYEIPASVVYIRNKSLGYCNGEYVKTEIAAPKGSAAIEYAKTYGLDYVELYSLDGATISYDETQFTYTGNEICPTAHVYYGDKELEDGTDYYLIYENNVNAGTATVTAYGIGSYRGELSASFVISPHTIDTSLLTVKVPEAMTYNKKGIYNNLVVTYDGKTLTAGTDFVVSGLSDKIGSVTGKIVFKGNYSGKKSVKLNLVMGTITKLYARGTDTTTAKLSWTDAGCDEYIIYRLRNGKYVQIATTKNTYYYDKSLVSFGIFYYKVKGVVYAKDGTAHTTKLTNTAYAITKGVTPTLKLATKRNANTLTWSKVPRADGYKIYRMDNFSGEWKLVKKITKGTTITFTDRTVNNDTNYGYKVVAYRIIKNKAYYTPYSEVRNSTEYVSVLNAAELKNRIYEFKIENVQSSKSTFTTYTLSQKDREILSKFAREHFTSDMTRFDKLYTTLNWINKNVEYIQDQSGWNKIAGMSFVEAVFVQKTGQCTQYNGAMASMMSYMGYDVTLIHGWRGNWSNGNYWQHFWVEAHIGGIDYVVETGNYGSSGNWMYMPTPYKYTSGYIKNCRNL